LLDSEIAAKLAEAMGWVKVYCDWFIDGVPNSDNPPSFTGYSWNKGNHQGRARGPLFDPVTRWDHIGIVIDWMELHGKHLRTEHFDYGSGHVGPERYVQFAAEGADSKIVAIAPEEAIMPKHIALAALKGLNDDKTCAEFYKCKCEGFPVGQHIAGCIESETPSRADPAAYSPNPRKCDNCGVEVGNWPGLRNHVLAVEG
jgi:hypothetical protein